MTYYVFVQDEKINGTGQCKQLTEGVLNVEVTEEIYNNIEKYTYKDGEIILDPNYEEKIEQEIKQARINEILAELDKLDIKSIRAIRTNDEDYIKKYEEEAEFLRSELKELQK